MKDKIVSMIVIMFAVAAFGMIVFVTIDSCGGRTESTEATVVGKTYRPAEYNVVTRYDSINERMVTETQYEPERFVVQVRHHSGTSSLDVHQSMYNRFRIGEKVQLFYKVGSITGGMYPQGIHKLE
jgi:hypothetical protein